LTFDFFTGLASTRGCRLWLLREASFCYKYLEDRL
jgi:hypothetical protein